MYIKNPVEIERRSMEIIEKGADLSKFSAEERLIVKRMIHTTGDFDYGNIALFKEVFVKAAVDGLKNGGKIFTDTRMAYSGINKKALGKLECSLNCYIDHPETAEMAKNIGTTRSACAVDIAVKDGASIFVVGNAPTALFRLGELIKEGRVNPSFVVGVPVGFVGAAESKEYIRGFDVPWVTTVGTKGGSNVAASIINALLYMVVER